MQHSSRGVALHYLSAASNRKFCRMRCRKSSCEFRRLNINPMDCYSYHLKHYSYWLYCIYMPFDNEFVACADRKKSYGTQLLLPGMIQQNVPSSSSSSVKVRVGRSSWRSSSSSSSSSSVRVRVSSSSSVRVRVSSSSRSSGSGRSRSSIVVVVVVVVVAVVVITVVQ